ncbi:hypothetical protein C2E23DRAFT_836327 [Lenzites betulinus]|nr:hypothetical protein C2E23DRAFT_836327 [Lenzites betulinus]
MYVLPNNQVKGGKRVRPKSSFVGGTFAANRCVRCRGGTSTFLRVLAGGGRGCAREQVVRDHCCKSRPKSPQTPRNSVDSALPHSEVASSPTNIRPATRLPRRELLRGDLSQSLSHTARRTLSKSPGHRLSIIARTARSNPQRWVRADGRWCGCWATEKVYQRPSSRRSPIRCYVLYRTCAAELVSLWSGEEL